MNFKKLKIGQKVWNHNGEFPVQIIIESIDEEEQEVWCNDGWNHSADEIWSSESKCKLAN